VIDLFCGRIGLGESQAEARARSLRPISAGVYEIVGPIQFKAGEKIMLEEIDKTILGGLECLSEEPARQAPPATMQPLPAIPAGPKRGRKKR
jgi:hypothetical protein